MPPKKTEEEKKLLIEKQKEHLKNKKELKKKLNTDNEKKKDTKKQKSLKEDNTKDNDLTTDQIQLMMDSGAITNKEALKDKIHSIHNYLRNNGAGYGMNALKVFNIIYGLKKIEEAGLIDKVNLKKPECEFQYLLKLANKNDNKKMEKTIDDVLQSIYESNVNELLFYEIPKNIKSSVFTFLIKEINDITKIEKSCNVLLSGKIYEYFIGRDASAISELGAYFTDRHIVDYIMEKLDPSKDEEGEIGTMIDMFGGSGGFTTGYINFLNEKYKDDKINWKNELNKVFHFDMNEDVIKSAGLEFFCLTGQMPDMNNNTRYKNSFKDEFNNKKYKYVITNPPYGGDKNKKSVAQIKREKLKKYINDELKTLDDKKDCKATKEKIKQRSKQLKNIGVAEKQEKGDFEKQKVSLNTCSTRINAFAKKHKLKGNDKESCSLILMMDTLGVNGTSIGVLKEGVFFDKKYRDLRECLVENFNVREIISIPSDQFENTKTKTSIIIFDNTTEKTSNIIFRSLIVERYEEDKFEERNGIIVLIENNKDIKGIKDELVSEATKAELLKNANCSFNGKDYNKKTIKAGEGYELVKLGDICDSINGYAFKPAEYKKKGIPLISIKHIKNNKIIYNNDIHYIMENDIYSKYEIKKNDIIISLTGKKPTLCSIAINDTHNKQYLNQRCAILRNFTQIDTCYFVTIFYSYILDYINNNIGLGSNQENISLKDILNIHIPIPKDKKKIKKWVDKISEPFNAINDKNNEIKEIEEKIKNKIKNIEENEECEEVELDDVCEFMKKKNKYTASDGLFVGKYRFYTSSQEKILYRNDYEFENKCLLIGRGGNPSIHCDKLFSVSHDDVYVLTAPDNNINYIYHYIKNNLQIITDTFSGSTIKHSSKNELCKINLKLPKNKKLIDKMQKYFDKVETLKTEVKEAEILYDKYIKQLGKEAIISN
jgi:type I restriction enzyme S subunit